MIVRLLDMLRPTKYRVVVDGVGIHLSRSLRKATQTYEAEIEFAKLVRRSRIIHLMSIDKNNDFMYIKTSNTY